MSDLNPCTAKEQLDNETFSMQKYRQYICENSPELRDFERKLQAAYNRKMLEAQLALQKTDLLCQKIEEKEIATTKDSLHAKENERAEKEREKKIDSEKRTALILQKQIYAKKEREADVIRKNTQERLILEEEIRQEKMKELRLAREKQEKKVNLLKEQLEVLSLRRKLTEDEQRKRAEEEEQLRKDATKLAMYDEAIRQQRQQQIAAFEAIKEQLAQQLAQIQRIAKEKEEIKLRFACLEKEILDRQKEEKEENAAMLKKELCRQTYDEITRDKRLEAIRIKEEATQYAQNLKNMIEHEEERDKEVQKQIRRIRTAVRKDNSKLIKFRREVKAEDLAWERARAQADVAEQEARDKIVREERMRLLKSLDDEMLGRLPPGTLTQEDQLLLNKTI